MLQPKVVTMTAWPMDVPDAHQIGIPVVEGYLPLAISCHNTPNLDADAIVMFAAYLVRELSQRWGFDRANEIVYQAAQKMTMKSQFRYDEEPQPPHGREQRDEEDDWDDDDRDQGPLHGDDEPYSY